MTDTITDNMQASRFEMEKDGRIIFAWYQKHGDTVHLLHVEAPEALRGTGAAGTFMRALMEYLRAEKLKAFPVCSYAAAWLSRHPEFSDLAPSR